MLCQSRWNTEEDGLLEALDGALCMLEVSPDGMVIDANENYLTLSGYAHDDLIGKAHRSLCPTDFAASREYGSLWNAVRCGERVAGTYCGRRRDGTPFWIEGVYSPMVNGAGELTGVLIVGMDVGTLSGADTAMAPAGKSGRCRFGYFDQRHGNRRRADISLEAALRRAIREGGLTLHYQPQVYFGDGSLYGAEALSRWSHPEYGDVPPATFIAVAEESGLIEDLSEWVVAASCRQIRDWRERSIPVADISINLSAFNFHATDLPERIARRLRENGLEPTDIVLELTESVLLDDNPSTIETIYRAHDMGFSLSLDDFGTGYSSLGYLRNLPISAIKLDRVFIRDINCDETSRRLSQAIMRLGESLDLTVVVEGVETEEQYQLLRAQGYHILQGHYVSRPLPAEEFERWVSERADPAVRRFDRRIPPETCRLRNRRSDVRR